jgi:folate-binding protein YgfZ
MTAPDRAAAAQLFDLSARLKLRVAGADRLRFLNGQITNDVRKGTVSTAIEACILNAKGKMDGHAFVHARADCFIVDAGLEQRDSLPPRLERYIIADDVQVDDVSDQLSILHVLADTRPELSVEARIVSAVRFIVAGWDVWIESGIRDEAFRQLSRQFQFCDDECAEIFRIEQGIPRWGRELTPEIIPIEANLEARCIDYEKGCYIGQETISRMKMSGHQKKKLCGLVSRTDLPVTAGMRLLFPTEGKEAGWITSVTRSRVLSKPIALGYVKRGFNSVGSRLEAIIPGAVSTAVEVEIVDLPFVDPAKSKA